MNISKKQKMFPELNETSNINKNQVSSIILLNIKFISKRINLFHYLGYHS